MAGERRKLIKDVWPDKRLYACTMLFVAGLAGVMFNAAFIVFPMKINVNVPQWLYDAWPTASLVVCLLVVLTAWLALRQGRSMWGFTSAILGVASLAFFGLVPLLALIALGFLIASVKEGEDEGPDIHKRHWPDKSLAASLLALVSAIVALAWGGALFAGAIEVQSASVTMGLGAMALAGAALNFAAAFTLYRQRAPWIGVAGGALTLLCVAFYVVGPLLGIAELVLLRLAWSEDEFLGGGLGGPA